MRIKDDTVSVVAGDREEEGNDCGAASLSRFSLPRHPVSDGNGSIYFAVGAELYQLKLPLGFQQGALAPNAGAAAGDADDGLETEGLVWPVMEAPDEITGLACDRAGSVYLATETAVYHWYMAPGSITPQDRATIAGSEGTRGSTDGVGAAARFEHIAGLTIDADDNLYVLDINEQQDTTALRKLTPAPAATHPDGSFVVTTLLPSMEGILCWPDILPNGYLAACNITGPVGGIHVLDLGLRPQDSSSAAALSTAAAAGAPAPPRRSLATDLRALLDRQPDGTADIIITVGGGTGGKDAPGPTDHYPTTSAAAGEGTGGGPGTEGAVGPVGPDETAGAAAAAVPARQFHVHRTILCARSDYFRQCLGGDFRERGAQALHLPDVSPEAFAAVLRFMYTGSPDADDIDAGGGGGVSSAGCGAGDIAGAGAASIGLLQDVAELADRLLLPDLCADVQARLLEGVTEDSVMELMVWAYSRGEGFARLLSGLKGWYLARQLAVLERSAEAVKRLMVGCPELAYELQVEAAKMARR